MDDTGGNQHAFNSCGASPSSQSIHGHNSTASDQTWSSAIDHFSAPEDASSSSAQTCPPAAPSRPIITSHVEPLFQRPEDTYQDSQPQGASGSAPRGDPAGTQASSDDISGASRTPTPPHRVQPSAPRPQYRSESSSRSRSSTTFPQGASTTAMPPHAGAAPPATANQIDGQPWNLDGGAGGGGWFSELNAWARSALELEMRRWTVHSVMSVLAPGGPPSHGTSLLHEHGMAGGEFRLPTYGNGGVAAGPPWLGPAAFRMAAPNAAQPGMQQAAGGGSTAAESFRAGGPSVPARGGSAYSAPGLFPSSQPANRPRYIAAEDAQAAARQRRTARRAPAVLTLEAAARRGRWRKGKEAARQCRCPHCSHHHHHQQQQQQEQGISEGGGEDGKPDNAQASSQASTATLTATGAAIARRVRARARDADHRYPSFSTWSKFPVRSLSTLATPPVQTEEKEKAERVCDDHDDVAAATAAAAVVLRDCAAAVERMRRKVEDVWQELDGFSRRLRSVGSLD